MTKQWNEFAKDMYEMVEKNMELMEKFAKIAVEQNEKAAAKNVEAYFNLVEQNIATLNTMWKDSCKNREDLRETYVENMKNLYKTMTKTYRDTVEKFENTTTATKSAK